MADQSPATSFCQDEPPPLLLTSLFRLPLINLLNQLDLQSLSRMMRTCRALHDFCAYSGAVSLPIEVEHVTWMGRIAVFYRKGHHIREFQLEGVPVRVRVKVLNVVGGFANPALFSDFVTKLRSLKIESVVEMVSFGRMLSGDHLEQVIQIFNVQKVLIDHPPPPDVLNGPTLQSLHHLDIHGMSPSEAKDFLLSTRIPEVRLSSLTHVPRDVFHQILQQWREGQRDIEKMRFLTVASPSSLLFGLSPPYRVSARKASVVEKRADGRSLYCRFYNWHRGRCYIRLSHLK